MVISKVSNSRISLSRVVISATAEQIRLFLFGLTMFTIKSTLAKIKGFLFRTSSSFRSRSYQMAVKCFLTSCLFGFVRPSLVLTSCLVSFFFCYQYVGLRTCREEEKLRHSLLQKLQLKYTRNLVDRFKIPLDISIVDNTSDGFG